MRLRRSVPALAALGAAGLLAAAVPGPAGAASPTAGTVSSAPKSTWQFDGRVDAAVLVGNAAFVGGEFTHAIPPASSSNRTPVPRARLAVINMVTGDLLPWNPGANAKVWDLAASADGRTLYAGGDFTMIGSVGRSKVAAFSTATGALLSWSPRISGRVRAIAVGPVNVFLGGSFTKVGSFDQPRLARVSATTGAMDTAWTPRINQIPAGAFDPSTGGPATCPPRCAPEVTAIALANSGDIYVGGHFGLVNGAYRNQAAEVTVTSGATMAWNPNVFTGAPTNPNQRNFVYGIAVSPSSSTHPRRVFLCGDYYRTGGNVSPNVAAVDAVTGGFDPRWRSSTDGGTPACVLGAGDLLYLGGHFRSVGGIKAKETGVVRNHIAALPASDRPRNASGCYCAYPNEWAPTLNSVLGTHAIAASATWLEVGGDFTLVNGRPQARFAGFPVS